MLLAYICHAVNIERRGYTDSMPNDITPNDSKPNDINPNDI